MRPAEDIAALHPSAAIEARSGPTGGPGATPVRDRRPIVDLLSYGGGEGSANGRPPRRVFDGGGRVSAEGQGAEDRDLAARAARGEAPAFSRLIHKHSDLVYRVSLRMLGANDAPDASQEAWVRAWRNIEGFRGDSAFSTWLYRIVMNTCLNTRRKESRREAREVPEEFARLPEPSAEGSNPEASTLDQERREEILEALQHVRSEHRAAVFLRHMEGLQYQEIAEVLEVPVGTAKGWVHRGQAELFVLLSEDDEGENR